MPGHAKHLQSQIHSSATGQEEIQKDRYQGDIFPSCGYIPTDLHELKFLKRRSHQERRTDLILRHLSPTENRPLKSSYRHHQSDHPTEFPITAITNTQKIIIIKDMPVRQTPRQNTRAVGWKKRRRHEFNTKYYCHLGYTLGAKTKLQTSSLKCIPLAPTPPVTQMSFSVGLPQGVIF